VSVLRRGERLAGRARVRPRLGRVAAGLAERATAQWRRSIQVRVVVTTLVLSLVVVTLLGALLLQQVSDGLLGAKRSAALAEADAGFRDAQLQLDAAAATDPTTVGQLITQLTESLATRVGEAGTYEVVLLSGAAAEDDPTAVRASRASGSIEPGSVPQRLRAVVAEGSTTAYTYTRLQYADGRTEPGLAVGAQVAVPNVGFYELYYLFPLTQERATLTLVRGTVATAGVFLVVLLAGIAWLVSRSVVTPVRLAAGTAERLAAGRLEERMEVRGGDELARLATSFNEMAASLQRQIGQLEDLSRVQRRFVSDVSHELRTPLTTVRMAADVLHEARHTFDPATKRAAELLQAQLDRFEELLAELLEISRFDAGAAHLEPEPVDMGEAARRVVAAAEPLAERRGSVVHLDLPDQPAVAEADPRRVERILRNLVVNAIEHGDGEEIVVRVGADDDAVAVTVRDHGVGLRPGEAALVFNRFWRADPARARTTGGTGLGLSIALEDARLHGGSLQAWGRLGVGSQFRLTLPRRSGGHVSASPLPLAPPDAAPGDSAGEG
jgi:two-component system, OmpR family, sensor histidine kinase MtrB